MTPGSYPPCILVEVRVSIITLSRAQSQSIIGVCSGQPISHDNKQQRATSEVSYQDGPKKPRGCDSVHESYLMECDGKLLSVFVGNKGRGVSVYTLDESEMAWQRVTDLGSKMLFVCHSTSVSSTKVVEGMENKVYFPRFCGKDGIFYCLATIGMDPLAVTSVKRTFVALAQKNSYTAVGLSQ
ncbi:unnamed protein product [Camellia sinensis]